MKVCTSENDTLRVQVPNYPILLRIVTYTTTILNPSTKLLGRLDHLGYVEALSIGGPNPGCVPVTGSGGLDVYLVVYSVLFSNAQRECNGVLRSEHSTHRKAQVEHPLLAAEQGQAPRPVGTSCR